MKATLASIRLQSEKLHKQWTRDFAGKPRHTRDLAELEKLLEKATALARKAKGIPGEKGDALERGVVQRMTLYRTERDAIAEAQYDRPEVGEIHRQSQRVDRALALWRRHYAGRDRRTRDLTRLDDMIATLSLAVPRLEALSDQPEVDRQRLDGLLGQFEVLKDERGEIEKLRRQLEPAQRSGYLLAEAQSALDQYRVHFAGQPRPTTSVARLDRLIGMLTRVVSELGAPGLAESQGNNLQLLQQHLTAWQAERPQLVRARASTSARDLSSLLGQVALQLGEIYQRGFAGKERASCDLQVLSDVCDRLTEVLELMEAHDQETAEPLNRKNLALVDERLRRYETEWGEIAKAQRVAVQQAAQAAVPKSPARLPGITLAPKKG